MQKDYLARMTQTLREVLEKTYEVSFFSQIAIFFFLELFPMRACRKLAVTQITTDSGKF